MARFEPTDRDRALVNSMSGIGIPQEQIALVMGCTSKTLRRHFRKELDTAEAQANANVARNLYSMATSKSHSGPTVAAAIFWMKTRAGWRETQRLEHSAPGDGGGVQVYLPDNGRQAPDPKTKAKGKK